MGKSISTEASWVLELQPTQGSVREGLHPPPPPPTAPPPPTSTHFRTSAEICVTHVDSGLRRSRREFPVSTQRFLFLIFCFCLFLFFMGEAGRVGGAGEGRSPGSCFVFSFSRFTRHGADDDNYYYYSNYHYINYCYLHSQYICWAPARANSTNLL